MTDCEKVVVKSWGKLHLIKGIVFSVLPKILLCGRILALRTNGMRLERAFTLISKLFA